MASDSRLKILYRHLQRKWSCTKVRMKTILLAILFPLLLSVWALRWPSPSHSRKKRKLLDQADDSWRELKAFIFYLNPIHLKDRHKRLLVWPPRHSYYCTVVICLFFTKPCSRWYPNMKIFKIYNESEPLLYLLQKSSSLRYIHYSIFALALFLIGWRDKWNNYYLVIGRPGKINFSENVQVYSIAIDRPSFKKYAENAYVLFEYYLTLNPDSTALYVHPILPYGALWTNLYEIL